jgi:hypothetical protein
MENEQHPIDWLYERLKISLREEIEPLRGFFVVAKEMKPPAITCDVCGSSDVIDVEPMGRNCNWCNPL